MPNIRREDLNTTSEESPKARPTTTALQKQVDVILGQLNELSSEHDRTRRGATTANKVASETSRKVADQEERIGLLESMYAAFESVIGKMNDFSQRMRGHDEDLAGHEERITRLERSTGSNTRGIFLVWLVTVLVTEAVVFLGWLNMAGLRNGAGRKLGDIAGYDTVFTWAAVAVFVVITVVTLVIRAWEPKSTGSPTNPTRQVPEARKDDDAEASEEQSQDSTEEVETVEATS